MTAQLATPARDAQPISRIGIRWREALGLGGPMLLLAALALPGLGALSFWRDEVVSIVFASAPVTDLLTIIGRERDPADLSNMAAYYLLLHAWLGVSQDEGWVRLLSVLFGLASVVPVYFIARRLGGWPAAALAATVYVLLPFVVHYSREARPYSLTLLVTGLLTWLVLIATERSSVRLWLAYGIVGALGLYVHPFIAPVIATHGAWVLATRQMPPWRHALAAVVPLAIAAAPIPFILRESAGGQAWIPALSPEVAGTAIVSLLGGVPLLVALTVLFTGGLVLLWRDRRSWLLAASVLAPIAAAALISLAKPIFIDRYLIVVLPALAVFVAWTIVQLRPPLLAAAAIGGLAFFMVLSLPQAYADRHQQDWRAAGSWVAEEGVAGDTMLAGRGRRSLAYYVERAGGTVPASTRVGVALDDPGSERLWVAVLGSIPPDGENELTSRLSAAYEIVERRAFGERLTMFLMERRPAG